MPCFYDAFNKRLCVTIGHRGGLYTLFSDGSTTRLENDVGGSVVKAFNHTTFDRL